MNSYEQFHRLKEYESKKKRLLAMSLIFDLIGLFSYMIPGWGEFGDLIWAPAAGIIYFGMYRGILGAVGGSFTALEEIIPFTDIVPTFTLTWFYVYHVKEKRTKQINFAYTNTPALETK